MEEPNAATRRIRQRFKRGAGWFFAMAAVGVTAWLWFPIIALAAHRYNLLPTGIGPSRCLAHHSRFFADHPEFFGHYRRTMREMGALNEHDYWVLSFAVRLEASDSLRNDHECGIGCAALHADPSSAPD